MFKQLWATKLSQPSQDSAEGLSMQRVLGVWG